MTSPGVTLTSLAHVFHAQQRIAGAAHRTLCARAVPAARRRRSPCRSPAAPAKWRDRRRCTLPTTPSGVMTPMSRPTPSRAAAVEKGDAAAGAGAGADDPRGQHGHFARCAAKIKQRGQPVGLRGAAFEFRIAQSQAIQLGAQFLVFATQAAHGHVVVPAAPDAVRTARWRTRPSGATISTAQTRIRRTS